MNKSIEGGSKFVIAGDRQDRRDVIYIRSGSTGTGYTSSWLASIAFSPRVASDPNATRVVTMYRTPAHLWTYGRTAVRAAHMSTWDGAVVGSREDRTARRASSSRAPRVFAARNRRRH